MFDHRKGEEAINENAIFNIQAVKGTTPSQATTTNV